MIISFSKLGNHGRAGNQFFQIMATLGFAEKYNSRAVFPPWSYDNYFINRLPQGEISTEKAIVEETGFHYENLQLWENNGYCDLKGYFQSEKYFPSNAKDIFKFKPDFLQSVKAKLPDNGKQNIAIHIRRGDYLIEPFVNLYYQLPVTYFISSLISISNWQDYNIIIFSDDLNYCKIHFGCLENIYFPELNEIETIAAGTFCQHFVISNSTFCWWIAWLGEKEGSIVIHPGHLFAGRLKENDTRDFWPDRWTRYQQDRYKLDLTDITFTIPVFYDHKDRKQNLDLSVCMLQTSFDTNIIVGEQGGNRFEYMKQWCQYQNFDLKVFHRTKMLNDMAMAAQTLYIANWDADVIIPPLQVYLAVLKLRHGKDMVFPYDGRFSRWSREVWFKKIEKSLDIGITAGTVPVGSRGKDITGETSVGGAIFFNKESFIDGGMENEKMISFGPEDCERNDRFQKLGFKIDRVGGALYHIDHFRGPDSSTQNPFFRANHVEIEKIRAMSKDDLRVYVDSWSWRHKYTEAYYKRILHGAIKSAKEVYKELQSIIEIQNVIDIGCGCGEWSNGNPDYMGVDFNIPKRSLMIKPEQYINLDLEKDIYKSDVTYDLCLCLEVAEHISESRADILIEMLCNLSDKVLFSAAIPFQGGTGHINEQWQSYWAKKFSNNGFYACTDQPDIRDNENIELWYRQNIILFVKKERIPVGNYEGNGLDFVHPKYYEQIVQNFKNQINLVA